MQAKDQPKFERNGFYERIIELRRTNRRAFDSLSPATKLALAEYEKQKLAHEQEERGKI